MPKRLIPFVLILLSVLLGPARAFAHPYRLPAGHEAQVLALLTPYSLGAVIADDQKLWTVSIEETRIRIGTRGPSGEATELVLVHPEDEKAALGKPVSPSFAVLRDAGETAAGARALDLLLASIQRNDKGDLWVKPKPDAHSDNSPGRPRSFATGDWWPLDGIALLFVFFAIAVVLAVRLLRDEARWMRYVLPAIVLFGALLRLSLAPVAFLGAWPWSRLWPNVRAVSEGPLLSELTASLGHGFYLTDVIFWTNFSYAALMPLVLFVHASFLLRDTRAGLFAAFAIAVLPHHIRFSRCEDAFIPSLLLTSLSFALIHGFLRDPLRALRVACLVLLPIPLYAGYLLRPLNMLFVAVYAAAVLFLHPEAATRARRGLGLFVVVGIWLLALPTFVRTNREALGGAAGDLSWVLKAFSVLFTPKLLVLSDPQVTPPVLMVLAVVGGVLAYRRGEKRIVLFLCGWLGIFLVAHAVVVVPSLMPRYHLHLVVPFLLLAAVGLRRAWPKSRLGCSIALVALLFAPLLHRRWIADLSYTEMAEFELVQAARDQIPEGCTIVEYAGEDPEGKEMRFARIGARVGEGARPRFEVVPVFARGVVPKREGKTFEQIMKDPPACLYVYEGLSCYAGKSAQDPGEPGCYGMLRPFQTRAVSELELVPRLYDPNNVADRGAFSHHFHFSLQNVLGLTQGR